MEFGWYWSNSNHSRSRTLSWYGKGGILRRFFHYQAGKGHVVSTEDIQISAEGFHRYDLATAPFLYLPDYPESRLRKIVAQANSQQLGKALIAVDAFLSISDLTPELKRKAELIRQQIETRVEEILNVAKTLGETDPILTAFYAPLYEKALTGHHKLSALKIFLAPGLNAYRKGKLKVTQEEFAKKFPGMFVKETGLVPSEQGEFLENCKTHGMERSQIGTMASQFLMFLLPSPEKKGK